MPDGEELDLEALFYAFHPFAKRAELRRWLERAGRIEAELHPGGRATLTDPDMEWLQVEIRFGKVHMPAFRMSRDNSGRTRMRRERDTEAFGILSYKLSAPGRHIPFVEISLSAFVAALRMRLESPTLSPTGGRRRPHPGKPAPRDFYKRLDALYEQLVRDGHPSPIKEIARRYRVPEGTVKSWRFRGRRYLKEENS
jgi:hypothetical protein